MQSLIDNSAAGFYSCRVFLNYISVSFTERFHWNELIEDEYCDWYASMVAQFQADEYQKLDELLPGILEKLKTGIFVWNEHFLGYSNDLETEMLQLHSRKTVVFRKYSKNHIAHLSSFSPGFLSFGILLVLAHLFS